MWIFCCGMYRAGSTLQFQITAHLVEEAGFGKRVEWVTPELFPHAQTKHEADRSLNVFKAHICTDAIAEEFQRHNAVGVYVYRDIRDVVASVMRKRSVSCAQLIRGRLIERCIENDARWTSLPGVLVSRYEEMIMDIAGEVKRIAAHIGIVLSDQSYKAIAVEYALDRQIARIEQFKEHFDPRTAGIGVNKQIFDPKTLLHINHISSGTTGEWRHLLSAHEIDLIEQKAGDWLRQHDYALSGCGIG